jgi:hypothetical protein
MSSLTNTYLPSQLVSLDILNLLGKLDSPILRCAGKAHTNTFDEKQYIPGMTVGYQISGIPPVQRGDTLNFESYEQRTLYIKADTKRWYKSVTHAFNQTDDIFYMNPKLMTETISAPTLKALKESVELEGAQWLAERSPVIPSYGRADNQVIDFKQTSLQKFNSKITNYLNKLRRDLIFPANSYRLILNTRDDMALANSLTNVYDTSMVQGSIEHGRPTSMISGFPKEVSPYMGKHTPDLTVSGHLTWKFTNGTPENGDWGYQDNYLTFISVPTSDENPIATLKNNSGVDVVLKAGDIIYNLADDSSSGLKWIQNTVKRAVPDSRYAFVVTSDKYISERTDAEMKTFDYADVSYTIPAGQALDVSLSHKPISSGYHQNINRAITLGGASVTTGDKFVLLGAHYKNHATMPEFFKMKSFKIPPLKSTEHAYAEDGKVGLSCLITHDRVLAEGSRRGNIFDVSCLPCFGAVSQNLFTLPTSGEEGFDPTAPMEVQEYVAPTVTVQVPDMGNIAAPVEAKKKK